ncbi:threonylcarbamoyl-AMP synthase [Marinicauda salina]|uniref:Threonylcarbamoyl-AMP synthase n=1 Tax=Marinicauda salina TaxID=2135793 RepID=A0A2U2BUB7_9PROT|nr:L-threonylcarbamoyladenylate synthase [Marinicauda salina]PWE17598.1 threonylcarbamoyl-AMP synthase [Marinicauda salina]
MTVPVRPADDPAALDAAAEILAGGGLVAVPTETVYGLAADATNGRAVARIFEAKGRPRFNPLIAHVDSIARAERLVDLGRLGHALADAFWPGPLTVVAKRRAGSDISDLSAAGLDTLAVRWPDAPAMTALIGRLDRPIAAPSANPSGAVSPTTAAHVAAGLGDRVDLILDGGPCRVGLESTIVAIDEEKATLLRAGGVERGRVEAIAGPLATPEAASAPTAPGMLSSHYAPPVPLRLNAQLPHTGESWLAFGSQQPIENIQMFNLSPTGNLAEAAANLFAGLTELGGLGKPIAVSPIPESGLGEAINDRLRRAAAAKG